MDTSYTDDIHVIFDRLGDLHFDGQNFTLISNHAFYYISLAPFTCPILASVMFICGCTVDENSNATGWHLF